MAVGPRRRHDVEGHAADGPSDRSGDGSHGRVSAAAGRTPLVGSIRSLDFWVDEDDAARYRARRARGTRAPVGSATFRFASGPVVLAAFGTSLFESESMVARVFGAVLLAVFVLIVLACVRYLLKPVDDELDPCRRRPLPLARRNHGTS